MIAISDSAHCPPMHSRASASGCLDFSQISHGNILQAPLRRPEGRQVQYMQETGQEGAEGWMEGAISSLVFLAERSKQMSALVCLPQWSLSPSHLLWFDRCDR